MKKKSIILTTLLIILTFCFSIVAIYKHYFYPNIEVKSINSEAIIDNKKLLAKFFPNKLNLSLSEISLESKVNFTEEELTDLFISVVNEIPDLKNNVTGLKVNINNNKIYIFINFKYNNLPLQIKTIFMPYSENGEGIFHFQEGKIGFINIEKDTFFKYLEDTSIIQFDKKQGNVIISFVNTDILEITDISTNENNLDILFKAHLNLFKSKKDNDF